MYLCTTSIFGLDIMMRELVLPVHACSPPIPHRLLNRVYMAVGATVMPWPG